jgi:hypothetical protein
VTAPASAVSYEHNTRDRQQHAKTTQCTRSCIHQYQAAWLVIHCSTAVLLHQCAKRRIRQGLRHLWRASIWVWHQHAHIAASQGFEWLSIRGSWPGCCCCCCCCFETSSSAMVRPLLAISPAAVYVHVEGPCSGPCTTTCCYALAVSIFCYFQLGMRCTCSAWW